MGDFFSVPVQEPKVENTKPTTDDGGKGDESSDVEYPMLVGLEFGTIREAAREVAKYYQISLEDGLLFCAHTVEEENRRDASEYDKFSPFAIHMFTQNPSYYIDVKLETIKRGIKTIDLELDLFKFEENGEIKWDEFGFVTYVDTTVEALNSINFYDRVVNLENDGASNKNWKIEKTPLLDVEKWSILEMEEKMTENDDLNELIPDSEDLEMITDDFKSFVAKADDVNQTQGARVIEMDKRGQFKKYAQIANIQNCSVQIKTTWKCINSQVATDKISGGCGTVIAPTKVLTCSHLFTIVRIYNISETKAVGAYSFDYFLTKMNSSELSWEEIRESDEMKRILKVCGQRMLVFMIDKVEIRGGYTASTYAKNSNFEVSVNLTQYLGETLRVPYQYNDDMTQHQCIDCDVAVLDLSKMDIEPYDVIAPFSTQDSSKIFADCDLLILAKPQGSRETLVKFGDGSKALKDCVILLQEAYGDDWMYVWSGQSRGLLKTTKKVKGGQRPLQSIQINHNVWSNKGFSGAGVFHAECATLAFVHVMGDEDRKVNGAVALCDAAVINMINEVVKEEGKDNNIGNNITKYGIIGSVAFLFGMMMVSNYRK